MKNKMLFEMIPLYKHLQSFECEPISFDYIWNRLKDVYNDRRIFDLLHIDY